MKDLIIGMLSLGTIFGGGCAIQAIGKRYGDETKEIVIAVLICGWILLALIFGSRSADDGRSGSDAGDGDRLYPGFY